MATDGGFQKLGNSFRVGYAAAGHEAQKGGGNWTKQKKAPAADRCCTRLRPAHPPSVLSVSGVSSHGCRPTELPPPSAGGGTGSLSLLAFPAGTARRPLRHLVPDLMAGGAHCD